MNILYADDTYAKASQEDTPRKIHIFGGIVVNRDVEIEIIKEMREIKSKYTHPNMPIKWNFKDTTIQNKFKEFHLEQNYEKMLANSREWRLDLFKKIDKYPYTIILSCLEAYSDKKEIIHKLKNELNTYCFENVLMRVGLDAQGKDEHWQCVLDWPPDNNSKPFDCGYYQLFHFGKTSKQKEVNCGPLEKLGFSHSLHFTRANHSPMMQLADLILGATRDHIECKMQERHSCVGSEAVDIFYNHFRNKNGSIPNYGVIGSTRNRNLREKIAEIFRKNANNPLHTDHAPRGG
jgi:hypothetical protein